MQIVGWKWLERISAGNSGWIFLRNVFVRRSALILLSAENDSRFAEIVGGKLHLDSVARNNPNKMFAHFSGDVGEDEGTIG